MLLPNAAHAGLVKGKSSFKAVMTWQIANKKPDVSMKMVSAGESFVSFQARPANAKMAVDPIVSVDNKLQLSAGTILVEMERGKERTVCTLNFSRPKKGRVGNWCFMDPDGDGMFSQGTGMGFIPGIEAIHVPKKRFAVKPFNFDALRPAEDTGPFRIYLQLSKIGRKGSSATFNSCIKKDVKNTRPASNIYFGFEPTCFGDDVKVELDQLPAEFGIFGTDWRVENKDESKLTLRRISSRLQRQLVLY